MNSRLLADAGFYYVVLIISFRWRLIFSFFFSFDFSFDVSRWIEFRDWWWTNCGCLCKLTFLIKRLKKWNVNKDLFKGNAFMGNVNLEMRRIHAICKSIQNVCKSGVSWIKFQFIISTILNKAYTISRSWSLVYIRLYQDFSNRFLSILPLVLST